MISLTPRDAQPRDQEYTSLRKFAERNSASYTPGVRKQALALSGGGMYGAYSVGVLCGWSSTGARPEFDVVTGVSTGSLIATYAFLGAAYDRKLYDAYTSITNDDIFRKRWRTAIFFNDAYASSWPLQRLIDEHLDDGMIAAVAKAHASGRRLYFGTTNIDTRRLVIWDMTAIAASGRRALYRQVLLASASLPGFLPPVAIEVEINGRTYTEYHCDGGATTGVFLRASNLPLTTDAYEGGATPLAGSDAYVIVAGKYYSDPVTTPPRTLKIGESALQSLLYSQTRSELFRIYALCTVSGMRFHLAAVPQELSVGTDAMTFDRADMMKLYSAGFDAAVTKTVWRDTPPGAEPQEQTAPRTGTQFLAPR